MSRFFHSTIGRTVCASITLVGAVAPASANITRSWGPGSSFSYVVTGMPDFDQRRNLLPGSGTQYCAPTCGANQMAYLRHHGFTGTAVDDRNVTQWQATTAYTDATDLIDDMGSYMYTSATGGTTFANNWQGIEDFAVAAGWDDDLTVSHWNCSGTSAPTAESIARIIAAPDPLHQFDPVPLKLVNLCVGWYDANYTRQGGHIVSLTKLSRTVLGSFTQTCVRFRDPWPDANYTTQSAFASAGCFSWTNENRSFSGNQRTQSRIVNYNSGTNRGYIDGYIVIQPLIALTNNRTDDGTNVVGGSGLRIIDPRHPAPDGSSMPAAAATGLLLDAAMHPQSGDIFYIPAPVDNRLGRVVRLDRATGESTVVAEMAAPRKLVFSRMLDLYVLDGDELVRLNPADVQSPELARIPLPLGVGSMAVSDQSDEILLLAGEARQILAVNLKLERTRFHAFPQNIGAIGGPTAISVAPKDGALWISAQDADAVFGLALTDKASDLIAQLTDEELVRPRGIDVTHSGKVLVSSRGQLLEFSKNEVGQTVRSSRSAFGGLAVGDLFQLSRGRTNYDPSMVVADVHLPPNQIEAEIPDVPGDVNGDGRVDNADADAFVLAITYPEALLATYPSSNLDSADVNGDGDVNNLDIDPFVELLSRGSGE